MTAAATTTASTTVAAGCPPGMIPDGHGIKRVIRALSDTSVAKAAQSPAQPPLTLTIKPMAEYRLKRIEIKRSDAIDQIKLKYDDDTSWSNGHDGGKADSNPMVLTEGEYLCRVTHETYENFKCAGAAVEFETNKGRVFAYAPHQLSTKWKSQQVTVRAEPGMEIISMVIRHGVLLGSVQQDAPAGVDAPVPVGAGAKPWYTIASLRQKEDVDADADADAGAGANTCAGASNGTQFAHFSNYAEAKAAWGKAAAECEGGASKSGRASLLLNAVTLKVLLQAGTSECVALCTEDAREAGFFATKAEEDVSMIDAIRTMFKLLNDKGGVRVSNQDLFQLAMVIGLLGCSMYLELEACHLTGHVMTMVSPATNASIIEGSWYATQACRYAVDCTERTGEFRFGMIAAYVTVRVIEKTMYVLNVWFHHNACDRKNHQLRAVAFQHVLSLDQTFYDTHSVSEIRGSMNVHSLNNLITWNIPYLCTLIAQMVLTGYFMVRVNVVLGGAAVLSMVAIQQCVLKPIAAVENKVSKVQCKLDRLNDHIQDEAFNFLSSVKLFSKEQHHHDQYHAAQQRYMSGIYKTVLLRCVREFLYGVLKVLVFAGILYYGMETFKRGEIDAAGLTAMYLLFQKFQDNFGRVKWHYELLVREFPDIERFVELMKAESTVRDGPVKPATLRGAIEFENVRFKYPGRPGEEVLKGLTLKIQPNKMTAIVGDSGAGKSTITKLLMRLYDPNAGVVRIDGVDVRDMNVEALHRQIAIVNQSPQLLNASLADNIGYGSSGAGMPSEEAIRASAALANCDFIEKKFRAGFDAHAGGNGGQLSGGQKQRIAIARAAIRDPSMLILDEATSALDADNEQLVQEALERIMKGRTIVVIAHRLSTVKNADEIICMKDGEVVEKGSHAELMRLKGAYYSLVLKQVVAEETEAKVAQMQAP